MFAATHAFRYKGQHFIVHDAPLRRLRVVYAAVTGDWAAAGAVPKLDPDHEFDACLGFELPPKALELMVHWCYHASGRDVDALHAYETQNGWTRAQWELVADCLGCQALLVALRGDVRPWRAPPPSFDTKLAQKRLAHDEEVRHKREMDALVMARDVAFRRSASVKEWFDSIGTGFLFLCFLCTLSIAARAIVVREATYDRSRLDAMETLIGADCGAAARGAWQLFHIPPARRETPLYVPFFSDIESVLNFLTTALLSLGRDTCDYYNVTQCAQLPCIVN